MFATLKTAECDDVGVLAAGGVNGFASEIGSGEL